MRRLHCLGSPLAGWHQPSGLPGEFCNHHVGFLQQRLSEHTANICPSFAPLFLSVAIFSTFARLSQLVMPAHVNNTKAAWTYFTRHLTTFTLVPCLVPLVLFGVGIVHISKFLSPAPIEGRNGAFERLLNYELGIRQLEKAHGSQAFVCLIFAIFAGIFTIKSKSWEGNSLSVKNKNWRELMCTINIVNGAILLRSSYKVLESQAIAQSKASLGDNGPLFWLFDVMPMVAALVLFCGVKPTSYLPDQNASIALDLEAPYVNEKRGYTILDSAS